MRNFTLALQKVGRRRTPKVVHPLALRQQLYFPQLDNIHFLRTVTFFKYVSWTDVLRVLFSFKSVQLA